MASNAALIGPARIANGPLWSIVTPMVIVSSVTPWPLVSVVGSIETVVVDPAPAVAAVVAAPAAVVAEAAAVVAVAPLSLSSPHAAASNPTDNSTDPMATPLEAVRRAGRLRNVPPMVGVSRCTR